MTGCNALEWIAPYLVSALAVAMVALVGAMVYLIVTTPK